MELQTLGEHVRALRLEKPWSQVALADLANVSLSALQGLEAGKGSSTVTLARVLSALGISDWADRLAPVAPTFNPLSLIDKRRAPAASRRRAPRHPRNPKA